VVVGRSVGSPVEGSTVDGNGVTVAEVGGTGTGVWVCQGIDGKILLGS